MCLLGYRVLIHPYFMSIFISFQSFRLLRISSLLKERAAKLEGQAWGLMSVATAGANVKGLWDLMESIYGLERPDPASIDITDPAVPQDPDLPEEETPDPSTPTSEATTAEAQPTTSTEGATAAPPAKVPKLDQPEATILYPPLDTIPSADLGVPAALQPSRETIKGKGVYVCPTCKHAGGNRASLLTHVRREHVHVMLGCPQCPKSALGYYSTGAWCTHLRNQHGVSVPVPPAALGAPFLAQPSPAEQREAEEVVAALASQPPPPE